MYFIKREQDVKSIFKLHQQKKKKKNTKVSFKTHSLNKTHIHGKVVSPHYLINH